MASPTDVSTASKSTGRKSTARPSPIMDVGYSSMKIYFAVLSAAACDAALLHFATNLDDWNSRSTTPGSIILSSYFSTFGYNFARIADVRIGQYLDKTPIFKRQPLNTLALQLSFLSLALSTKVGLRILIGLDAFPMFRILSGQEVQRASGQGRSSWSRNTATTESSEWVMLALIILCTPLYYILGIRLYSQPPHE